MPVGIVVIAPEWRTWGWSFEENSHEHPDAKKFLERTKEIEFPAPVGFKYPSVKYPFKWDKSLGLHVMKEHEDQNLINIEDFLDHPLIEEMMGESIDQILYYDKAVNGKEWCLCGTDYECIQHAFD